jgi:hypothetical protein
MMKAMSKLTGVAVAGTGCAWCLLALSACGGAKQAQSPGTCPEGTILSGENCLPESGGGAKASDEDAPKGNKNSSAASAASPAGGVGESQSGNESYDKEAVESQLRRAAKQVQANCGSASDDEGNKTGPWGSTTATILLGRNGHVQGVTVPAPYSGAPVGDCVANSFKKIQYPPFNGSGDASITWDVQIVEPKHK